MKEVATRNRSIGAVIFALLLLTTLSSAWSINGHLYVANIAERILEEESPEALEAAYDMLKHLTDYDSDMTWREQDHALVECSSFADDYKYRGEAWQGSFHFIQLPWIDIADDEEEQDFKIRLRSKNITEGVTQIVAWISGKQGTGYKDSYIYTYLLNKYSGNEDVAKSYAFRLLVHLVGDIVQPLHSMNRFNEENKKGDLFVCVIKQG